MRLSRTLFVVLGLAMVAYSALAQKQSGLLLYPDPVIISPGQIAVVDVRLSADAFVSEIEMTFVLGGTDIRFVDMFVGTKSEFRPVSLELTDKRLNVTLRAVDGFIGDVSLGSIMISAADTADIGVNVQLGFEEGGTALYGAGGEEFEIAMRPAQIRIGEAPKIQISSTTHGDEGAWYSKRNANVTWDVVEGAEYSYKISSLSTAIPDAEPEEEIGAIQMNSLADGIWYFVLCEIVTDSCEDISRRRYMIDGAPPEEFDVRTVENESDLWEISFYPYDEQSGVASTEVALDSERALAGDEGAWETITSPYTLPNDTEGEILVRALDRAGNARVVGVELPGTSSPLLPALLAAFGAFIVGVAGNAYYRKRQPH